MRGLPLLLAAAYLAAAALPCPDGPARGVARVPAAEAHDAHAGHAHHHAGGSAPAVEARAAEEASVTMPCPCGCEERASLAASPARLGAVLTSAPVTLELPRGTAPAPSLLAAMPEAPTRSLDPVPRISA